MRRCFEPVWVEAGPNGAPQRLVWCGRPYRVLQVEDCWRYRGKWWLNGRGWARAYFRLTVQPLKVQPSGKRTTLCLEVFRQSGTWVLARVLD